MTRADIEALIERLIALLDRADGDPDVEFSYDGAEPDADGEPSLGATDELNQRRWSEGAPSNEFACDSEQDIHIVGWSNPT